METKRLQQISTSQVYNHELDIVVEPEDLAVPLMCDAIEKLICFVLQEEQVERPCCVSVSIVDDLHMQDLNRQWRGIDRPTDVLSLECERPDDPDLAPGEPCELGDLVLAPCYIEQQVAQFGTTPATEMSLLIVHGVLHLLGYDHLEEDEAQRMEQREDELLSAYLGGDESFAHSLTRHRAGIDE